MLQLEDRRVPAAFISNGVLVIEGTPSNDAVMVSDTAVGGVPTVQVELNGAVSLFTRSAITANKVQFQGGSGADSFYNLTFLNAFAYGGDGNDTLYSEAGRDTLNGQAGNDYLDGNDGNDTIYGEAGNDTIWAGAGNDTVSGSSDDDQLFGEEGDDYVSGDLGNDLIY